MKRHPPRWLLGKHVMADLDPARPGNRRVGGRYGGRCKRVDSQYLTLENAVGRRFRVTWKEARFVDYRGKMREIKDYVG